MEIDLIYFVLCVLILYFVNIILLQYLNLATYILRDYVMLIILVTILVLIITHNVVLKKVFNVPSTYTIALLFIGVILIRQNISFGHEFPDNRNSYNCTFTNKHIIAYFI